MTGAVDPHVVKVPTAFFVLRIIQLVISVILLGLLAYLTWGYNQILAGYGGVWISSLGLSLFCCILTIILSIYYLVTAKAAPKGYNLWAVISLESLAVLFWLIAFALLADTAAYFAIYTPSADAYTSIYYTSLALAVIEWILFIVTLVLFSVGIHRHRKSGMPTCTGGQHTNPYDSPKQMEAQAQPMPGQQAAPPYQQPEFAPQPMH